MIPSNFPGVLGILPFLFLTPLASAASLEGVTPGQVRMVWKGDTSTTATLSWTTAEKGRKHRVKLRAEGDDDWTTVACQRSGQFGGTLPIEQRPFFHHARLTGLEPATKYQIVCQSDQKASREYFFLTAPTKEEPVAVLFGGDSRSGLDARKKVNRMIARMVAEQSAAGRPAILAFVHGGDYIVDGRKLEQWLVWLTDHELTIGGNGRLLPIIPARGNHDLGPLFNEIFDFPKRDGNYYATDLGPEVRLATLNTEVAAAGDQRKWLASELSDERWDHRWYFCQYHRPAFPAVKFPSSALTSWVPLFEEHHVDLVCEADGHNIKRTPPIKGTKVDPTGVVYIGEGGLGVGHRVPITSRWYLQETAEHCSAGHHLHLLTFSAERLNVRVIRLGGKVFDEFALLPRQAPEKTAVVVQPGSRERELEAVSQ